jgi:hypothetical protein
MIAGTFRSLTFTVIVGENWLAAFAGLRAARVGPLRSPGAGRVQMRGDRRARFDSRRSLTAWRVQILYVHWPRGAF